MGLIDKIFRKHKNTVEEQISTADVSTGTNAERRIIVEEVPDGISVSDSVTPKTLARCAFAIKQKIVNMIGPELYERKLDEFDPDLADAYRQIDFWMLKTKCVQAELEYYRACNDPNGFHGPQLREMHDRVCELRNYLDDMERNGGTPDVNIGDVKNMFSDIHNDSSDDIDEETGESNRNRRLVDAMNNHEKVSIFIDAPMPNTMPPLPINCD